MSLTSVDHVTKQNEEENGAAPGDEANRTFSACSWESFSGTQYFLKTYTILVNFLSDQKLVELCYADFLI